ncbi:energy-coupling factor transporter transmembrane component T family protein [Pseudomonadota bacterium]
MLDALLATTVIPAHPVNIAPRLRLLLALAIACAVVFSEHWLPLQGYGLLAIHLWRRSSITMIAGLKRLAAVDGFIVLTVILLPFTEPGEAAFTVGGVVASHAGITLAAMILLKANIIVIVLMAQCAGLNALTLSRALAELKMPHKLVLMMQLSIRYISVMQQEFTRLRCAMKARGFCPNNSLHTWRSYGYLFGMVLVRAMDRADRIWLAMKCRGFNGRFPTERTVPLSEYDKRFIGGYLIVVAIIFHLTIVASWLATTVGVQEWL